jgi:hypothetical protein
MSSENLEMDALLQGSVITTVTILYSSSTCSAGAMEFKGKQAVDEVYTVKCII